MTSSPHFRKFRTDSKIFFYFYFFKTFYPGSQYHFTCSIWSRSATEAEVPEGTHWDSLYLKLRYLSPYWITTDRSVVQPTKKHLQCTPVQVAYRVFNRDQSVRDGQFICILHACDFIFDSIGFYHSSGAPPVGADYLLWCKIMTVTATWLCSVDTDFQYK